jgi:Tetracyclin repressor-like, C-terminal domain
LDQIVTAWPTPPGQLGEQLVRQMLANWHNPGHEPVFRAVMQIAGNVPGTREKLRNIIERSMMGPSAQALNEDERALRSSLIASQLMGLAFMRFVWRIEPLASMDDEEVVAAIAPTIQRYLDGEVSTATRRGSRRVRCGPGRRPGHIEGTSARDPPEDAASCRDLSSRSDSVIGSSFEITDAWA